MIPFDWSGFVSVMGGGALLVGIMGFVLDAAFLMLGILDA